MDKSNVSREDWSDYGKSERSISETSFAYKGTGREQGTVKFLAGICD
jgi:hypothetical protein